MSQWPASNSDHARVYKWLKAMAIDYRFRPGEHLMIGELAEHLRVSSTPVRETLIRLQAESLLDTTPRRGFFAKTLDLKEMIDLFQFRFLLVKNAIEQAADRLHEATVCTASPLAPNQDKHNNEYNEEGSAGPVSDGASDQLSDCVQSVERVAESIVALSRNDLLARMLSNANDRTRYILAVDLAADERLDDTRRMI